MPSSSQKIHLRLEKEILRRVILVASEECNGNVSQYIRITVLNDLIKRGRLTDGEKRILEGN